MFITRTISIKSYDCVDFVFKIIIFSFDLSHDVPSATLAFNKCGFVILFIRSETN